jgi:hypothetical protein
VFGLRVRSGFGGSHRGAEELRMGGSVFLRESPLRQNRACRGRREGGREPALIKEKRSNQVGRGKGNGAPDFAVLRKRLVAIGRWG